MEWWNNVVQYCSWNDAALGTASVPKHHPGLVENSLVPMALQCPRAQPSNKVALALEVIQGGLLQWLRPLRMLQSHLWMLFLPQPPVEGRLGLANVSPQGGTSLGAP